MFDIGFWEIATILLVAVLIFGPDKLPGVAADAARLLRELRRMASGARQELADSLGPEFGDLKLEDLNPRTFVRKNLFDGMDDLLDDEPTPRNGSRPAGSGPAGPTSGGTTGAKADPASGAASDAGPSQTYDADTT